MSGEVLVQTWLAALDARGIACDAARRQRMANAAPLLERMRQRVRDWRVDDDDFTARFEPEPRGEA